jgi:hypothetical protein
MRVEKCAELLLRRIRLEVADVELDTWRLVLRPLLARGAAELVVVLDRAELRLLGEEKVEGRPAQTASGQRDCSREGRKGRRAQAGHQMVA